MDPLIADMQRERRLGTIIVVAVVVGILASSACTVGYALGGLWQSGDDSPPAMVFCAVPFVVCLGVGYALRGIARLLTPLPEPLPRATARPRA